MIVPDLNKVLIIVSTEEEPQTRPQEAQCPFWTSGCDCKKRGGKWAFPTENKAQTCLRVPALKQSNGLLPFPWHTAESLPQAGSKVFHGI